MLEIRGLCKRHGQREVLRGVDLALSKAQVGVLVGPSGGGKSTVLRCINGLDSFHSGRIAVGDQRLDCDDDAGRLQTLSAIRQCVGMVFQQFNLFPHKTVLGNVIEAPTQVLKKPREQAIGEAMELLARVGLADRGNSMPHQLSGGQQQRVAIARALAMRPELVLFDEPTSALDPKMTAEVLAVMGDLAAQGQTMLVVTHAMSFARRAAHQVFVMADGLIAEAGPPAQIFDSPREPATKEFLHQVALG